MMFINQPTGKPPNLPFGSIKNFGHEREPSSTGVQKALNTKPVRVASASAPA